MLNIRFRIQIRRQTAVLLVLVLALPMTSLVLALAVRRASAAPAQRSLLQQASPPTRRFYISKTLVGADQALTTCASGYHFASLWEIADPSKLQYDTALGLVTADSGKGPPTAIPFLLGTMTIRGWVRTGYQSNAAATAGHANCSAWSSTNGTYSGTVISLPTTWTSAPDIGVWNTTTWFCDTRQRVWCVQDDTAKVFLPLVLKQ